MSISNKRLRAEKAARVYLEMRGFKLIEQNWSLGKYKIDFIAEFKGVVHFISVKFTQPLEELSASQVSQAKRASEAWAEEAKYSGPSSYSQIVLAEPTWSVISFNENVI